MATMLLNGEPVFGEVTPEVLVVVVVDAGLFWGSALEGLIELLVPFDIAEFLCALGVLAAWEVLIEYLLLDWTEEIAIKMNWLVFM